MDRGGFRCSLGSGTRQDPGSFSLRRGDRSQDRSPDAWTVATMRMRAHKRTDEAGFTLIESLVALALTGLVLSALANLTAQWLPNWNRGLDRVQRSEMIGITLQRIADDLAAAEYVPVGGEDDKQPLFVGSDRAVTFVRTALGPNVGPGLD